MAKQPVELDGRTLEGGGQLLRIALCLSALTGVPIRIDNIRGARSSGGGLKAQHLAGLNWLAVACAAEVQGAVKGSTTVLFEPFDRREQLSRAYIDKGVTGNVAHFESSVDIGTAGSTGLVLQAILPYILFAPPAIGAGSGTVVHLQLRGGTNVSGSPSYEYIVQVLLPTLASIGLPTITPRLINRGWSQGRASPGRFVLDIPITDKTVLPAFDLRPIDIAQQPAKPTLLHVTFLGPAAIHQHLRTVLIPTVQHYFGKPYRESTGKLLISCEDSGTDKRLYLIIVAVVPALAERKITEYRLGRDWLYDRKVCVVERAVSEMCEKVASDIYDEWRSGAWVDEHMRDQLVIFAALAQGRSSCFSGRQTDGSHRVPSLHAQTAEWVAKKILNVRFEGDDCDGHEYYMKRQEDDQPLADLLAVVDLQEK